MSNINPTNLNSPTSSTPQPTTQQQLNPSDSKIKKVTEQVITTTSNTPGAKPSSSSIHSQPLDQNIATTAAKTQNAAKRTQNNPSTTQQLKNVASQQPVKSRIKTAAVNTTLSTFDIICEIVSGTAHGFAKEAASDAKIGIGALKAVVTLPLIAVKVGKSIYHGAQILNHKAALKSKRKLIKDAHDLQTSILKDIAACTSKFAKDPSNEEYKKELETFTKSYTQNKVNIVQLEAEEHSIEEKINTAKAEMFDCKEVVKDLVDIANSCVHFAIGLGSHLKTLPPSVLSGLTTAATVLGTVAGGLTVAFGLVDVAMNIKNLYHSIKRMREIGTKLKLVNEKIEELNKEIESLRQSSSSDPNIHKKEAIKNIYLLEHMALTKERNIHKSKVTSAAIAIGAGALVVTGGALAIAAAFTGGATALILAGVGFGIGIAVTGIKIANYIKGKYEERMINAELNKKDPQALFNQITGAIDNKTLTTEDLKIAFQNIGKQVSEHEIDESLLLEDFFMHNLFPNILERTDLATE